MDERESDIFEGLGVEITLPSPDNFLKIKETLMRIGIGSKKNMTLYQSCHILHKRGRYAIIHFKEMFLLDGKDADFAEEDLARRNTIVNLLDEWGLLDVISPEKVESPVAPLSNVKVISFRDKHNWVLKSKYNIGGRR